VTNYIPRNKIIYDVIRAIHENSIVQVYGHSGMGKSTIVREVTTFLSQRQCFSGSVYIDCKSAQSLDDLLIAAYETISLCMPTPPLSFF